MNTFGDNFVQGQVEHIDTERQAVVLEGGRVRPVRQLHVWGFTVCFVLQEIQFTHLILSTGTDGTFPGRFVKVASHQSAVQSYEDFIGQV